VCPAVPELTYPFCTRRPRFRVANFLPALGGQLAVRELLRPPKAVTAHGAGASFYAGFLPLTTI
jgi:hypothetical protein